MRILHDEVHHGDRVLIDVEQGKMKFVAGRWRSGRRCVDDSRNSSSSVEAVERDTIRSTIFDPH